jgi:hypothetical protein
LFGALFVLNLTRREFLPGPYRWTIRWALLGIFSVASMGILSTRISHLGHVSGFVSGAGVCLALLPGLDLTRPHARPAAWIRRVTLAVAALYVIGIVQGVRFAATSDAWDVIQIARRSLDDSGLSPTMRLVLADWISHAPGATEADRQQALELARQARVHFAAAADDPVLLEAARSVEESVEKLVEGSVEESLIRDLAGGALADDEGLRHVERGPEQVEDRREDRLAQ